MPATIHKKALGGVSLTLYEKEFKKTLLAAQYVVLDKVGDRWLDYFLSRCPVDTGFMVSQGEYFLEGDYGTTDQDTILQAGVGDQVEYATIVEERTKCIESSMNDAVSDLRTFIKETRTTFGGKLKTKKARAQNEKLRAKALAIISERKRRS